MIVSALSSAGQWIKHLLAIGTLHFIKKFFILREAIIVAKARLLMDVSLDHWDQCRGY